MQKSTSSAKSLCEKRDEMIAKNLQKAEQNKIAFAENSLEKILFDGKDYIRLAKKSQRENNFGRNKTLENLLEKIKDR